MAFIAHRSADKGTSLAIFTVVAYLTYTDVGVAGSGACTLNVFPDVGRSYLLTAECASLRVGRSIMADDIAAYLVRHLDRVACPGAIVLESTISASTEAYCTQVADAGTVIHDDLFSMKVALLRDDYLLGAAHVILTSCCLYDVGLVIKFAIVVWVACE